MPTRKSTVDKAEENLWPACVAISSRSLGPHSAMCLCRSGGTSTGNRGAVATPRDAAGAMRGDIERVILPRAAGDGSGRAGALRVGHFITGKGILNTTAMRLQRSYQGRVDTTSHFMKSYKKHKNRKLNFNTTLPNQNDVVS